MTKKSTLKPADVSLLIGAMKVVFPTREDVVTIVDEALDKKIGRVPTKEEFFSRMDKLSGEIKTVRDEQILHQGQHDQVDKRTGRVEKTLHLQPLVD